MAFSLATTAGRSPANATTMANSNASPVGNDGRLRWSRSFTDRPPEKATQLVRRKSATERLEESKYKYIKTKINDNGKSSSSRSPPMMVKSGDESGGGRRSGGLLAPLKKDVDKRKETEPTASSSLEVQLKQLIIQDDGSSGDQPPQTSSSVSGPKPNQPNHDHCLGLGSVLLPNLELPQRPFVLKRSRTSHVDMRRQPTSSTTAGNELKKSPKNPLNEVHLARSPKNELPAKSRPSASGCSRPPEPATATPAADNSFAIESSHDITGYHHQDRHPNNNNNRTPPNRISDGVAPSSSSSQLKKQLLRVPIDEPDGCRRRWPTKSVSRSKSDASHHVLKAGGSKSKDDIERFFETLGIDTSVWAAIKNEASENSLSTPAHCIDDQSNFTISSVTRTTSSSMSSLSKSCSSDDDDEMELEHERTRPMRTGLTMSKSCHSFGQGTSIVEKNARVIKWLYNCRKAQLQS